MIDPWAMSVFSSLKNFLVSEGMSAEISRAHPSDGHEKIQRGKEEKTRENLNSSDRNPTIAVMDNESEESVMRMKKRRGTKNHGSNPSLFCNFRGKKKAVFLRAIFGEMSRKN